MRNPGIDPGRVKLWLTRLLFAGGGQLSIQAVGFIGGLLIIRLVSPTEYAYYTIATAALGMLTVLSDAGVSTAMLAIGGGCWQEPEKLGVVFNEAMRLRWRLAAVALVLVMPGTMTLLHKQGNHWGVAIMVAAAVLPLFVATITTQLCENLYKLHQRINDLQGAQLAGGALRAVMLSLALLLSPIASVALLAAGLGQWVINLVLARRSVGMITHTSEKDSEIRTRYKSYILRTLPSAFYLAFSGQLTVWLISIFGSTTAIAQVGVAGRLGMLCNVLSAVANLLFVPRFARLPKDSPMFKKLYWGTLAGLALVGSLLLAGLNYMPFLIDLILGPQYRGLYTEVSLGFANYLLVVVATVAYTLGAVREIILSPWISVSAAIIWQVLCIVNIDLSSAAGVLRMGCYTSLLTLLLHTGYFYLNTRELSA